MKQLVQRVQSVGNHWLIIVQLCWLLLALLLAVLYLWLLPISLQQRQLVCDATSSCPWPRLDQATARQLEASGITLAFYATYDVAIIGAGPIGLELAVALKEFGVNYVQFDAKQIGYNISWWPRNTNFFSTPERIAIAGLSDLDHGQSSARGICSRR